MKRFKKGTRPPVLLAMALVVALGSLACDVRVGHSADAPKVPPLSADVTAPAKALSNAYAAVASHVRPAVVSVYSEKLVKMTAPAFPFPFGDDFFRQFFGDRFGTPHEFHGSPHDGRGGGSDDDSDGGQHRDHPRQYRTPQRGLGSGMILDTEGHILTNYHVVKDVDEIKVQLADDRQFEAEILGTDPMTDVAVIRIKGKVPSDLPTVELGDSDALRVGDLVMAIGAPFGLIQTVTSGIISATGRANVGVADYEDFLQTDTAINPGNSGGPLVDMDGKVVGMNSAIATRVGQSAGVGFAIPVNMIKSMLPTLIKGEKVTRGLLGVVIQNLTDELAKQFGISGTKGALVAQVTDDSPAKKAGIKVGDVIVGYNGQGVDDVRHLRNLVAATAPGSKADVEVVRDGKKKTITVEIGTLPEEATAAVGKAARGGDSLSKLGLSARTLDPTLARRFNLSGEKGVVVTDVEEGSPASLADLRPGDLIVEADRQQVATVDELRRIVAKAKHNVLLLVERGGATMFVVVQKEK